MAKRIIVPFGVKKRIADASGQSIYDIRMALTGDDSTPERKAIRKMAIKFGGAYVG